MIVTIFFHLNSSIIMPFSTFDVIRIGSQLVGFHDVYEKDDNEISDLDRRRFLDHFGLLPETVAKIFDDLRESNAPKQSLQNILMCVHWLFCYPTEAELASRWGITENTVRRRNWIVIKTLYDVIVPGKV